MAAKPQAKKSPAPAAKPQSARIPKIEGWDADFQRLHSTLLDGAYGNSEERRGSWRPPAGNFVFKLTGGSVKVFTGKSGANKGKKYPGALIKFEITAGEQECIGREVTVPVLGLRVEPKEGEPYIMHGGRLKTIVTHAFGSDSGAFMKDIEKLLTEGVDVEFDVTVADDAQNPQYCEFYFNGLAEVSDDTGSDDDEATDD